MQKQIFYTLSIIALLLLWIEFSYAQLTIPGWNIIKEQSITINVGENNVGTDVVRIVFFRLLSFARIIVAGFALIYIVLMGVNMILNSENEGEIAKQKKQITYALIGFVFLNIPTVIYDLFVSDWRKSLNNWNWEETGINSAFINSENVNTFLNWIVDLLKVIAFIVAVVMLTYWIIKLILDRGKWEWRKDAQNILLYWGAGLLFLWIVEIWSSSFSSKDLMESLGWTGGIFSKIFGVALYFAAPIAVFFLILGAYYYITSMWDESKTKKWKAIIFNTFIATIILLLSYSILQELNSFF